MKSAFINLVSSICSASYGVYISSLISSTNPLSNYLTTEAPTPDSSSLTQPTRTLIPPAIRSTLVPVYPTPTFVSTTLAPPSALPTSFVPLAIPNPQPSNGNALSSAAIGGIAAGGAVAVLAILVLLWLLKRKNHNSHGPQDDADISPSENQRADTVPRPDKKHNSYVQDPKDIYQQHEPISELPGDVPTVGPASNRLSELNSIRPVSELSSVRPVSELSSIETSKDRWSATHTSRVVSPTLSDVAEMDISQQSQTIGDDAITKKNWHPRTD